MVKTTTQGTPGVKKVLSALLCLALLPVISAEAKTTGEDIYKEVIASTPIYDNPALDNYIRKLGEEIVAQSEMAGEKFTFTLLDSPDLNAFATRGNYVYVNRGLLNYINNEAQLVSVLAHEVGHITKKHVTGQEGQAIGAQVLSAVAGVLSGSAEVYEAGMKYSTSLMRSHGRNNELEADQAGAVYMAKLGYAPEEMLSMLSIMKDYETLQKDRAKAKGASKQTYHGIFSSHPRNDSRLRNVVTAAERLKGSSSRDNGVSTYRQLTEGLIWGENFLAKDKKPARYSDMTLRVREGLAHLNRHWLGHPRWFARVGQLLSANHHPAAPTVGPTPTLACSVYPAPNDGDQWQCSTWNINHPFNHRPIPRQPMFHVEHHPPTS